MEPMISGIRQLGKGCRCHTPYSTLVASLQLLRCQQAFRECVPDDEGIEKRSSYNSAIADELLQILRRLEHFVHANR